MNGHGKTKKTLSLSLPFIALSLMAAVAVFIISANYQELYRSPRVKNAVMDCTGFENILDSPWLCSLSGEWEFFYNRHIVSGGEENPVPDGMIKMPGRWTGKKINGEHLPKTGYASYRMTITGLGFAEKIIVQFIYSALPYRVFINGKPHTDWIGLPDTEKITVVFEVDENSSGGLFDSPWFDVNPTHIVSAPLSRFIVFLPATLFGGILILFIFSLIVSLSFSKKERAWTFPLLLAALILHFLTSEDFAPAVFGAVGIPYMFAPVLRYLTGALLFAAYFVHLCLSGLIKTAKGERIAFLASNAAAFILYFISSGTSWTIFPIALSLAWVLYAFAKIAAKGEKAPLSAAYLCINFILFVVLWIEAVDSLALIVYGFETVFSIGLTGLITVIGIMSFFKMRESQKAAVAKARFEQELSGMKMEALREQIKPHFIFNSLDAIRGIYAKDAEEGARMLTRFSDHLRLNINVDIQNLVSFRQELINALNYFELENIRFENALTVTLDTDFVDFSVPPLSLQPFVENAVKHGFPKGGRDGVIRISAQKDGDGGVTVEISDNGQGFDPAVIRPEAVGLKNAKRLLLQTLFV